MVLESSTIPLRNTTTSKKRFALQDLSNRYKKQQKSASKISTLSKTQSKENIHEQSFCQGEVLKGNKQAKSQKLAAQVYLSNRMSTRSMTKLKVSSEFGLEMPLTRLDKSCRISTPEFGYRRHEILNIDGKSEICCPELVGDIDHYYKKKEKLTIPMLYLNHGKPLRTNSAKKIRTLDIKPNMRKVLVDWLVEVKDEYELQDFTFYMAVNIMDRSLSKITISRTKLQLLGCACLFIASKLEEVEVLQVADLVFISSNSYFAEEIIDMESKIVVALKYKLYSVVPYTFLHRYMRAGQLSPFQVCFAKYLAELHALEYHMIGETPSNTAAAIVYLVRYITEEIHLWTPTLKHYTGYSSCQLEQNVTKLLSIYQAECVHGNPPKQTFITRRHNDAEHHFVSSYEFQNPEPLSFS